MTPLTAAHGLLLGLFLALPWLGRSEWLPWGAEVLFLVGGFQVRVADRRWNARAGALDWISHIRMAPARLLPWGAMAIIAVIARRPQDAQAIALAAILGETLVYPACVRLLGKTTRAIAGVLLLILLATLGMMDSSNARFALSFIAGVATGILWLRGPDGDLRTTMLAITSVAIAVGVAVTVPQLLPLAWPLTAISATLALAHLSMLRRRPMPWQSGGGAIRRFRRGPQPLASPPS